MNYLHTFHPQNILITLGSISVYWYGLFIVLGMLLGIYISLKLAGLYSFSKDALIDLIFWLIISGVIGARLYDVLLEIDFYSVHPLNILMIWKGGLAIHGAIIVGIAVLYFFCKRNKYDFWKISSILAPGLALAQAVGRWGNYFNQELFGRPTNLPWGIPIDPINRPLAFFNTPYFHPTFLYESLGSLLIFAILFIMHKKDFKVGSDKFKIITVSYLILYSVLRFITEFIRIDTTPIFWGIRIPQIVSMLIVFISFFILYQIRLKSNYTGRKSRKTQGLENQQRT